MPPRVTHDAPRQLLAPGTYWCAVVAYADGSGLINVYGPYPSKEAAEQHAQQLKNAGVNAHQSWDFEPLHLIDLGVTTSE
jgi:hypothetical protein